MQVLKVKRNTKLMIEPLDRTALFKHCTGGFTCIEFETFRDEIIPVLQAHNINIITYKEGK